jgi:hypothetical protein
VSGTDADRSAVIAKIETVPLRIPFKAGSTSDASLWGDKLTAEDSLLVKVTTNTGWRVGGRPSVFAPSPRPSSPSTNSSRRYALARMRLVSGP